MTKNNYHVGCGAFAIYAGKLNKDGSMWTSKSEVTDEAVSAAAMFLLRNDQSFLFTNNLNGKRYRMLVVEVCEEREEVSGIADEVHKI